jgi:hypothetical protein
MGQSVDQLLQQVKQETADKLREVLGSDYPPASAPGEPPRRRTGDLLESYQVDARVEGETVVVMMTPGVPYADMLEYGTGSMDARPHRAVVAAYLADSLPDRMQEAVTLDLLETLEPQGPAEPPPGFFSRAAAGVSSFFGF